MKPESKKWGALSPAMMASGAGFYRSSGERLPQKSERKISARDLQP